MYRHYLFLCLLLSGCCSRLAGQSVRPVKKQYTTGHSKTERKQGLVSVETQNFWVKKGDALMSRHQNYTAAYSAYLLAKSLGAAGMSDRMQLAQQKNIEKLRANAFILQKNAARLAFQAGLQQAENMAETDLTQSLRLLEFLQDTYCVSSGHDTTDSYEGAVLRTISEVVAHAEQGLYSAKQKYAYVDTESPALDPHRFKTDSLSASLRQQVDSIFQHVTIPDTVTQPVDRDHKRDSLIHTFHRHRGTYQFVDSLHLLFTFIIHTSTNARATYQDSVSQGILWRTDEKKLVRLHTFTAKFYDWPHLSPDGQTLAIKLLQESVVDSIWHVGDTQLIGLKGTPGLMDRAAFVWFSPDSRYAVSCGQNRQGIVWRIIDDKLQYMFSINGLTLRARFDPKTVTLDVFNEAHPDSAMAVTVDLSTQQQILPPTCYYLTKGTNVYFPGPSYFPGDNYLMVQHSAGNPHIVLYAIEDSWLVQCESLFWVDFRRGSMTPNGRYVLLRPRITSALPAPAQLWAADRPGHFQPVKAPDLPPEFNDALFSPDSRLMLLPKATRRPGQLYRLDSAGFRLIHTFAHSFKVIDCQFSPDGKWLYIDFPTSMVDSLWPLTPDGLGPAISFAGSSKITTAQFLPDQKTLITSVANTGSIQYYNLYANAGSIRKIARTDPFNALYAYDNQLLFSTTDTYLANLTYAQPGTSGKPPAKSARRLGSGYLVSSVFDDGETLFFVVYSDLSRRKMLMGYDKKLQQPVLSREVTGAFDLHMTADKSIQLADPSGLYTIVPPRKILRLLKTGSVVALEAGLSEKFSPIKP